MQLFPASLLLAQSGSNAALYTFLLYTLAVFGLAWFSNKLLKSKSFLSEYFLGSRSLGMWAFALTFAATSSSGGSFTGFPARIYAHGWILALWIASYMVVPICAMGLLAKRINQVARISGAITVPDVLRDRFHSAKFGLLATSLIVFFMSFNLVAQFKAGSTILGTLLQDVTLFKDAAFFVGGYTEEIAFFGQGPQYLICLLAFGVAVILYTTYGGFHAVVWTDVMQGVVMVLGVLIMLPLALYEVGGLENATRQLAEMTPPRYGMVTVTATGQPSDVRISKGTWLGHVENDQLRLFRVDTTSVIKPDAATGSLSGEVSVVEITTPREIQEQVRRLRDERPVSAPAFGDDRQEDFAIWLNGPLSISNVDTTDYSYGGGEQGHYVTGPGPSVRGDEGFLPLGVALSFFFMWAISGAGQPSSMVRLMAFNNSVTLQRSIFTVAIYYTAIYFPLVLIFVCARVLLPGMDTEADAIMPQMAVYLTTNVGHGWLAGLLVAAPFAAVMSTVDSFLLMISSALVRDLYQRNINPEVTERRIKTLSYLFTLMVGTGAMLGAVNPPQFLQDIIVYTGSGLAACFLAPMAFALYWPRVNSTGAVAGMLAGFLAHLSMYVTGWVVNDSFFKPYKILSFEPVVIGLAVSFITVYVVSRLTPPPPQELVRKYFHRAKA